MQDGEVLLLYVRSSVGIKRGLVLANGTGVIDKDYYSNSYHVPVGQNISIRDKINIGICNPDGILSLLNRNDIDL